MNAFEAKYTQVQISQATGVPVGKMRVWISRGRIKYAEADGDERGEIGLSHRLSARTALRIALTDFLSPFVDPSEADAAISKFMDVGFGATPANSLSRNVGELFASGETVLTVDQDGKAEVLCIQDDTKIADLRPFQGGKRFAVFPLNDLVETVLGRLDQMIAAPAVEKKRVKVDA